MARKRSEMKVKVEVDVVESILRDEPRKSALGEMTPRKRAQKAFDAIVGNGTVEQKPGLSQEERIARIIARALGHNDDAGMYWERYVLAARALIKAGMTLRTSEAKRRKRG
jgi:hypothetical protein